MTPFLTALMYPNQQLAAKYLYDPFGNMLAMSGPLASFNKYRFSSQEWNDNAGLYYFGRRFYDPISQRWINRDPIQESGGLNLYGFVENDPIISMDFLGFCDPSIWQLFGNGLNNTVTAIGDSMGLGLYDLGTGQWSQNQWDQINDTMYSVGTPENPDATPYVEGALAVSAVAAAIAAGGEIYGSVAVGTTAQAAQTSTSEEEDAAATTVAADSSYVNTTNPGARVPNVTTDASANDAIATLKNNGYAASTSADGQATILTDAQGNQYVIRPSNSAPGGMAADYTPAGSSRPTLKINFGKQ